jgi:flagellar biosynthesis/type III secretory pathway chaperone
MSLENLIVNLEKLEKMHRSLLETALAKTELIKNNDMEQLDQLLKSEQAHVAAIEILEKQRQTIVIDYLRANGVAQTDRVSVADVLAVANEDEYKENLASLRKNLILILEQLKEQNLLNQKLVFNSLQVVNLTLDSMRPQQHNEQFNYSGAEVRGQAQVAKKTYYDSQA